MRYDATWRSLFVPESGETPVAGPHGWSRESLAAEMARLAYYRHEQDQLGRLNAALAPLGFGPATSFTHRWSGTQAFAVLDREGTAWIMWRGTHIVSMIDVLVDLAFIPVRWDGGTRVHLGFRWAYHRLESRIDAWLRETPHKALVTTGHSLGGALATLFSDRHKSAELLTFGSPRVGNGAFAARFAGRSALRFAASCDGVSEAPLHLIGYVHVGEERYVDRTGRVHETPPGSADRRLDRREAKREARVGTSIRRGEIPFRSFTDHAPINYVSALLGIREN